MHVGCDKCESAYNIDENKIPNNGTKVKCPKCQNIIQVIKPKIETPKVAPINGVESDNKKCPYCAEKIMADAIKCRYCGEWLKPNEINDAINKEMVVEHSPEFINDSVEKTISKSEKKKLVNTFNGSRILKIAKKTISIICIVIGMFFFSTFGKIIARKAFNSNHKQKTTIAKQSSNSNNQQKQNAEIEKLLLEVQETVKSQLPMMLDERTRLDSMVAVKNQLLCKYTMVNYKLTEIDMKEFETEAKKLVKHNTCSNKISKKLVQDGAKYVFIYYDKDGYKITRIIIDSESCEN